MFKFMCVCGYTCTLYIIQVWIVVEWVVVKKVAQSMNNKSSINGIVYTIRVCVCVSRQRKTKVGGHALVFLFGFENFVFTCSSLLHVCLMKNYIRPSLSFHKLTYSPTHLPSMWVTSMSYAWRDQLGWLGGGSVSRLCCVDAHRYWS